MRTAGFGVAPAPAVLPTAAPAGLTDNSFYFLEPAAAAPVSIPAVGGFDIEAVRRDFPILHEPVAGKRLVWLDNAATTQKPQAVIDAIAHFYEHENSNIHRAAHTSRRARDRRLRARARRSAQVHRRRVGRRDRLRARHHRGHQPRRASAGARSTSTPGDEIVLTTLEHHANIVPWQHALRARRAPRCGSRRSTTRGQVILEEYERLLSPRTKIVAFSHVSNALGTVHAGRAR